MNLKRVCEWCGKEFVAKTVKTRLCSDGCRKTAYKHNKRIEFISSYNLKVEGQHRDYDPADHEVMTVSLASRYMFVDPSTINRCIGAGILKAVHLPGKTLIRKSDIDSMFTSMEEIPERSRTPPERRPTEYTTVKETAEKYSLSFAGAYKVLKENNVPSCVHRGRRRHFRRYLNGTHATRSWRSTG